MNEQRVGIIMNGVTGRMGLNQHLVRSILAIRDQGGVALADGSRLLPDPILVGRNANKLESIAKKHGVTRWTTDLARALANREDAIYFDAQLTALRARRGSSYCSRQAHLLRKTAGRRFTNRARVGAQGQSRRPQKWHCARQAVS